MEEVEISEPWRGHEKEAHSSFVPIILKSLVM